MLCGSALEAQDDSGGEPQVVLRLRARRSHTEARHQVFRLNGTNGKVIKQLVIHAATHGHRECILRVECAKGFRVGVRDAEEHLAERRDFAEMAVRHARPE